ncbi:hypothetical protein HPB50_010357 [Hyalomma asiaticum]|uniref:Uncharacterized protein n=1 Tax=Hyalomma asiaticum TaxID=266040 RepID=A0ACB7T9H8_HYAAI|nr:hypothetical protein HPB50_010357 [Hyalomma asiaticum]
MCYSQGFNVYWNHPRDSCDANAASTIKGLHYFLKSLKSEKTEVMLTVPPSRDLVRHYGLTDPLLESLSYVLVTTHKLQRCGGAVYCSGARQYAATAFHLVRMDYGVRHRHKFAYSISARVDTFFAKEFAFETASYKTPSELSTLSRKKSKDVLGLSDVCQAKRVLKSQDDECTLVALDKIEGPGGVTWHTLVAYTSPRQMQLRMKRAFDDKMGDAPVALFDSQLDDVTGKCETNGRPPNVTPLLAAMATTEP